MTLLDWWKCASLDELLRGAIAGGCFHVLGKVSNIVARSTVIDSFNREESDD